MSASIPIKMRDCAFLVVLLSNSGCAVVSVASSAVSVAGSVVSVGASAASTAVDVSTTVVKGAVKVGGIAVDVARD